MAAGDLERCDRPARVEQLKAFEYQEAYLHGSNRFGGYRGKPVLYANA
jgi:hypothetical protein